MKQGEKTVLGVNTSVLETFLCQDYYKALTLKTPSLNIIYLVSHNRKLHYITDRMFFVFFLLIKDQRKFLKKSIYS